MRWINSINKKTTLYCAWLIALCATLTSLFLSDVIGLPVCQLCWYQRIGFYPLAIQLGIALYRDDLTIGQYAIPLAGFSLITATYQYLEQMIPNVMPTSQCDINVPCNIIHIQLLGFMTIPFFSMLTCTLIILLLWHSAKDTHYE